MQYQWIRREDRYLVKDDNDQVVETYYSYDELVYHYPEAEAYRQGHWFTLEDDVDYDCENSDQRML